MQKVSVGSLVIHESSPLTLISGPCVIESREHTLFCAEQLVKITQGRNVQLIFKASYDKANRSSGQSFRGPGLEQGLRILEEVKQTFGIPVVSDIHLPEEADIASSVLDMLQIPAFLCRQTDLLLAAGQTMKPVHIKKGQFMAPWDMKNALEKVQSCGNPCVMLCDRGTSFGYNNLVCDMRSFAIMQAFGVPVSFDASHSVQMPGALGTSSGGTREHIPLLTRAAAAAGIQALFIESHPDPKNAKSDSSTVFPLDGLGALLDVTISIHELVRASSFVE